MTRFYFNCDGADIFDDDGADLIRIDAETQADAEAKLLAEPRLIGASATSTTSTCHSALSCRTDTSNPSATPP